ncbi:MAG: CDP-2,3-bis-(O-geranylgeranyl)-sn-glycerol synthase [Candidatus Hodarchaeota archaeon]
MLVKIIIDAAIFVFPAFMANASPTILGKGKHFNTPIDGGRLWRDNKRILGDGKTVRGFISGVISGMIICVAIILIAKQLNYPLTFLSMLKSGIAYSVAHPLGAILFSNEIILGSLVGFTLGSGALIGDLIGSFIKRRSGLKRGESFFFMDQLGFLITAMLFTYLIIPWPIIWFVLLIPLTLVLHISLNLVSYSIGLQEAPL